MKTKILFLNLFIMTYLCLADQIDLQKIEEYASNSRLILLRNQYFDPGIEIISDLEFGLSPDLRDLKEEGLYIIQFFHSPLNEERELIKSRGADILYYVPNNAYLIRGKGENFLNIKVRSFFKLPKWAKINPSLFESKEEEIIIQIMSTPKRDAIGIYEKIIEKFKTVRVLTDYNEHLKGRIICTVNGEEILKFLDEISSFDDVLSIDPWIKPQFANDNSIWVGQAYDTSGRTTPIWNRGITGTGQIVSVMDSGLDSDMCYFRYNNNSQSKAIAQYVTPPDIGTIDMSKKVIAYYVLPRSDPYDCSDLFSRFHGTHVAGSVAGDNFANLSTPNSGGHDLGDGMAPNAKLIIQDVRDINCDLSGIWGDMNDTYAQAKNAGAYIHNNSWSVPINAYTSDSYDMDEFTYRNEDFLFVVAMGNRGAGVGDGSIGAPATAKNVISVGVTTNGGDSSLANNLASFSGRGPTSDGRRKPDITAPGIAINSAYGSWSNNDNNCSSWTKDGTSMATPTLSGFTALARQYFIDGWYPSGTKISADKRIPSAALIKAALLNGAMPMTGIDQNGGNPITPIPSMDQGWGRIHLENVLYFSGDSRMLRVWDIHNSEGVSTNEQREYLINVTSSTQPLKIHLVWTDPESSTFAGLNLVNNLDLEVVSPGGTTYKGNVFSGGVSVPGGSADTLNNVEGVYITNPQTGIWTIRVKGTSIPGTGVAPGSDKQGYALVATFPSCSSSLSSPQNLIAQDNGSLGIDLSWCAVSGAIGYLIYRANGSSPPAEEYILIGTTSATSYTDTNAEGGYTYSYKVRAIDYCSESPSSSAASATASGACSVPPSFGGLKSASNDFSTPICDISLSWEDATSNCPSGPYIKYNIYRGTNPYFPIGPQSLIASGITEKNYKDTNVLPLQTYYYIVKAEDSTNSGGGPSNNGNVDTNRILIKETPISNSLSEGNWFDDGGDTNAKLIIEGNWTITNQQNRTSGGSYSYHNAPDNSTYRGAECNIIKTPKIKLKDSPFVPILSYYVKYNLESSCDGVLVEISEDDGATWQRLTPLSGYPGTSGCYPLGCNYPKGTACFTGNSMGSWTQYSHNLSSYAGKIVQIRWVSFSDQAIEKEGFYLDDISITNAYVNDPCGASSGRIFFDRDAYGCNNAVGISLGDSDLKDLGSIQVSIQSTTESNPENVTLTESPSGSGNFYGTIQTTSQPPPSPGKISISNGDTITVSYNDMGYGIKTDTAYGDCIFPTISNVQVSLITYNSAVVTWSTSEKTEGFVYYGTSAPLSQSKADFNITTNHSIVLTDLSTCTTYFFYVKSLDAGGNVVLDNNGGSYYSFKTKPYNIGIFNSTDIPKDIPDGPPGVISTINVNEDKIIEDINIRVVFYIMM